MHDALGAHRNSRNDRDLVSPPLAMAMNGSLALRSPSLDHVGNQLEARFISKYYVGAQPRRVFLSAASLFVSSVQSLFHPAPRPSVLASEDSISNCASNGRHGRGDAELHTYVGSVRQCERWSTDWFDSRAPEVLAKANDRKSTVPAKPFRLHFARIHRR